METYLSLAYEHETPLPEGSAHDEARTPHALVERSLAELTDHGDGAFGYGYDHSYCLTFTKTSA